MFSRKLRDHQLHVSEYKQPWVLSRGLSDLANMHDKCPKKLMMQSKGWGEF